MSVPFLPALLGVGSRLEIAVAPDADLADGAGLSWIWHDATTILAGRTSAEVREDPGHAATIGRQDNVSQAGTSKVTFTLDNRDGDWTPTGPLAGHNVTQNMPVRVRHTLDNGATWYIRYQGYLDSANPATDASGRADRTVPVTALGKLGQLAGQKKPLRSAMYRVATTTHTPAQLWPCEDGTSSSTPAPAVPGGQRFVAVPGSVWAMGKTDGVPAGAPAAASIFNVSNVSIARGPVPSGHGWTVAFAFRIDPKTPNVNAELAAWFTNTVQTSFGNIPVGLRVKAGRSAPGDGNGLVGMFDEGGNTYGSFTKDVCDGNWHTVVCTATNSGANVATKVILDGDAHTGTYANIAAGRITRFGLGAGYLNNSWFPAYTTGGVPGTREEYPATCNDVQIMGLAFWDTVFEPDYADALDAYTGEAVHTRIARLLGEHGIPAGIDGTSDTLMGPQGTKSLHDELRACEAADHGLMYDGRGPGVEYQCRSARYNMPVALTLDMAADPSPVLPPFRPRFDRQGVVNEWQVKRDGGGSATVTRADGPNGTDTIGTEDRSTTINISDDGPLEAHAAWLVGLGTPGGFRYPGLSLNMRGVAGLAAQVLAAGLVGYRVRLLHPASPSTDLPPDPIDLVVEGISEAGNSHDWRIDLNTSPYLPVTVVDDASTGLIGPDHAALIAPVGTADVTITPVGDKWTQDPADMPFDINLGGERCTVTAIAAGPTPLSRVGAFLSSSSLSATDFATAYTEWQAITGQTIGVTRWYQGPGDFGIGASNLAQMVAAGIKVCLTIRPDYTPAVNPAHLVALDTMLSTLKASGAVVNVALWHEPFFSGLTAAQFIAVQRFYGPTVRKYYPLWVVFSGADADITNGYYPGDAWCDGVAVDAYAASGTTQITNAQAIADAGGKPFGVWEFNGGADLGRPTAVNGQTQAAITAHFQFLQNLMLARLAAGKQNGDLLLFNSDGAPNGSKNSLGTARTPNGGFEGGLGNWVAAGGCTVAPTGVQHNSGTGAALMTSTGVANMLASRTAVTPLGTLAANALAVVPGDKVAGSIWYRAATVGRTCQTGIFWYDAAGTQIATSFPAGVVSTTTAFTPGDHNAVAPAGAAWAVLRGQIVGPAAAGEQHYIDDGQIAKMPTPNDLTSPIQYPWDYRIGLYAAMKAALDSTSSPQRMTVIRAVNGVVKAHGAGELVDVWQPARVAL